MLSIELLVSDYTQSLLNYNAPGTTADYDTWLIIELWVCQYESCKSEIAVSLILELIATAFRLVVEEDHSSTFKIDSHEGLRMVEHIRKSERTRYHRDRLESLVSRVLQWPILWQRCSNA